MYAYCAFGELPKCSKVAQTISGWPVALPTTCIPTMASLAFFDPFGVQRLGFALLYVGMTAFMLTQDEAGLFAVAGAFGVGFSALIPAYVLAIREHYPASDASWRVPTLLLMSGSGMAAGGWLAGVMYDYFGYYAPAFAAGVGTNVLNLFVIGTLVARQRYVSERTAVA